MLNHQRVYITTATTGHHLSAFGTGTSPALHRVIASSPQPCLQRTRHAGPAQRDQQRPATEGRRAPRRVGIARPQVTE